MEMSFKDIIAIGILVGVLSLVFIWKCKMAARNVKCNACGKVVNKDEWDHFEHCPDCKHTECTAVTKNKKK